MAEFPSKVNVDVTPEDLGKLSMEVYVKENGQRDISRTERRTRTNYTGHITVDLISRAPGPHGEESVSLGYFRVPMFMNDDGSVKAGDVTSYTTSGTNGRSGVRYTQSTFTGPVNDMIVGMWKNEMCSKKDDLVDLYVEIDEDIPDVSDVEIPEDLTEP